MILWSIELSNYMHVLFLYKVKIKNWKMENLVYRGHVGEIVTRHTCEVTVRSHAFDYEEKSKFITSKTLAFLHTHLLSQLSLSLSRWPPLPHARSHYVSVMFNFVCDYVVSISNFTILEKYGCIELFSFAGKGIEQDRVQPAAERACGVAGESARRFQAQTYW